jgi:hypothetical protein
MADICTDNRFELIEKYKKELIESTNIETAQDEMAVLDNLLFRIWQMGWLDRLEQSERKTGKWMRTHDGHYICDHCGEQCADEIMGKPRDRYCKWCGADMRGEE